MKRNDDQKEEDAILVGHSQFYAKNTFLLNKKWIDQIFSFDGKVMIVEPESYREEFTSKIRAFVETGEPYDDSCQ